VNGPRSRSKFDDFAESYTNDMRDNLAFSGESYDYFLEYKARCLEGLGLARDSAILDYGCGIGNLTQVLARHFGHVQGSDHNAGARLPQACLRDVDTPAFWLEAFVK
jgi:2-polyprenyl-3-methyl-5-hydroxy-6-metoxy-1,4-benzoquinol methylase